MGRRIDPQSPETNESSRAPLLRARALPLRFEFTRKAIHLASAAFPIAYATFLDRPALLAILIAATIVALGIEVLRRSTSIGRAWFERLTGFMLRAHEHRSANPTWVGATWLLLAFASVVAACSRPVAIASMCAVSFGDAVAALAGRTIGRRAIGVTGKTLEGSIACFVAASLAARWIADLSTPAALMSGFFGAAAEIPSRPFDDNVRVAIAAAVGAAIGMRLWG